MGYCAAYGYQFEADHITGYCFKIQDEEAESIINDIVSGIPDGKKYVVIPDRREAIRYAAVNSTNSDVVLISGKGHEDYQEIAGVKYDFSDAVELGKILEELNK